ncbi:DUF1998 domain-containing protein [Empedobacter falsenii]|uniref:DUF1998 domain-containing protein n=1 Tax=Empedobacter falsenii TaxID=343874 RepID=A0ABY8VCM0_9FLAO|nr:Zn-binding domain-containing protein [Empedobacter falsenii]WIH98696.1 DUF1998 domain-containing protein [Empedobacter falsenii]
MLDRKVREQLEKDFKKREKFNSTNTLLATSTLEMGIDIGSLNTAYNNSIPPLPSNFVQRVGRAGRSSGSALIVNFAKNQNHDLYYYADPLEMIQGEVNTPGCYLEAKDILKRHFIAYCIDSWTTANPNDNVIPSFVRDLKLSNSVLTSESFFINRLNHFIDQNKLVLKTNFLKQYITENIETNFKEINNALNNRSFYDYLLNAFYYLINNLNHLDAHKENIKAEIEILKLVKGDPLYEEYLKEIKNSNGLKKSILATNVLEYLTNVGILPNYAFPETGVKLNAHVIANKAEEALEKDINKEFEIIRPASQAIRELAPENTFYSQGYEFKISGVNTFDWSDRAVFHSKRFCSKCDHIAIDLDSKKGNCPKCGDVSWSSNANVHQFAKLTQVKSYVNKVNATLSDKSDDRDQLNYQVLNHVVVEQNSSAGAWVLKQVPFGIEFVKNATITSVNYGALDDNDARKLKINDQEVLAKGFVTCKQCGKSTATVYNKNNASDFHYGYCKNRDIRYKPEETTEVFEEVYFFREIKTELLKIILPIQSFNTNTDIQMFQAGLELGLKKYFKGNPNHIRIMIYREYNQNTEKFDRFLLLYDTIPGGTGYLEKLFDPNEFALLIQNSYDAIKSCSCQLEGHDGCYKCIYSYSNQYNRSDLSRERAEKWFHKIYSISADWVKNENGLTSLTTSGKIEESELEERFIQLLQIYSDKNEGFELNSHKIDGTINYQLSIEKDDVKANYWIRPQINLGPKDGIEYSTRTDFLIECTSFNYRGIDYENQVPNVAIYLDGYQYHASEEHNIFEKDLKIRQAIAKHPDFIIWSLTWSDLDLFENQLEQLKNSTDEIAQLFKAKYSNYYREKLVKSNLVDNKIFYDKGSNNVDRLLLQLIQPQIQVFQASWIAFLASWTSNLFDPSFDPNKLEDVLNEDLTVGNFVKESRSFDALIPVQHSFVLDFVSYRIWTNFLKREILVDLSVKNLNKIDKVQWNQFLALFNLFQRGIDVKNRILIQPTVSDNEAIFINQLFELYEEQFHSFLSNAVNKGFINKDNYEFLENLLDDKGNVIADALIIIKEIRIAIAPYSEESNQILNSLGYEIYSEDQINTIQL